MILLNDLDKVTDLAKRVASLPLSGLLIFLNGDLGVGKTTFVRALLGAMGYTGKVKSPTYTLVETYDLPNQCVHHFDLYRLQNPEELYDIGIEDYITTDTLVLVEWPEQGKGVLPTPDLCFQYKYDTHYESRYLHILGHTDKGKDIARRLNAP